MFSMIIAFFGKYVSLLTSITILSAMQCSGGKVYQECGYVCHRGCYEDEFDKYRDCEHDCVEGCHCPEGTVLNNGKTHYTTDRQTIDLVSCKEVLLMKLMIHYIQSM